jgi:hypothetical protein
VILTSIHSQRYPGRYGRSLSVLWRAKQLMSIGKFDTSIEHMTMNAENGRNDIGH